MEQAECPRLSEEFIKVLLESDNQLYFTTRKLNKKLYIHFKGLRKLENLTQFTGLKVLYAEGNLIEKIEGLEECSELRCLYLQDNRITEMIGMEYLDKLHTINLSGNCIQKIEDIEDKTNLGTLHLQRNFIGKNGISDLVELLNAENLSVLDLSYNNIDSIDIVQQVIYKLPKLTVLYFQGNPVCDKFANYRKEFIANMPNLQYLDQRPVFPDDRRFAKAYLKGGIQGEREERLKWEREKDQEKMNGHLAFKEMIQKKRQKDKNVESTSESNQELSQVWSSSTDNEESENGDSETEVKKVNYDDVD